MHDRLSDYDYALPEHLIRQAPPLLRGKERLLCVSGMRHTHCDFAQFANQLGPRDVVVLNDTLVYKARLAAHKTSGGRVTLLISQIAADGQHAQAIVQGSKRLKIDQKLLLTDGTAVVLTAKNDGLVDFCLVDSARDWWQVCADLGTLPLPPYIKRPANAVDDSRYQTIYGQSVGSVAAPTAGLHFTPEQFKRLSNIGVRCAYITLNIGIGTFMPVRSAMIDDHVMHQEYYTISPESAALINQARAEHGQVVAVGTTTLRALEAQALLTPSACATLTPGSAWTNLFIRPGFTFKMVDRLLTNFHLPKSSLLMLVAAFAGYDVWRSAYAEAIKHEYGFFSYGDAMLLDRYDRIA